MRSNRLAWIAGALLATNTAFVQHPGNKYHAYCQFADQFADYVETVIFETAIYRVEAASWK